MNNTHPHAATLEGCGIEAQYYLSLKRELLVVVVLVRHDS